MVALTDTSDRARQQQLNIYAAMSGGDKVMLAIEMAEQSKNIALDGIRSRHPHLTDPELHQEWLQLLHGDASKAFKPTVGSEGS